MDALVMAGGRGTRFDAAVEKPVFEIDGTPMIDRVLAALAESDVEGTYVATSPATPETREHVDRPCVETPGDGYVTDLDEALSGDDRLHRPVLTVAADLPLLAGEVVDRILAAHDGGALTVAVPVVLKEVVGASVDATVPGDERWAPSGLNVVDEGSDGLLRSWDVRLAVNVNRPSDATLATRLVTHESIIRDNHP